MTSGCFSRSRRAMASADAGEWWQTGKISSGSASARSTSSTMPDRMPDSTPGPSANSSAAACNCSRSAANGLIESPWARRTPPPGVGRTSRQGLDRLAAALQELGPRAALLLAARLDHAVPVLVEDGQVLGAAPGQRADQRPGQRAGAERAVAEEVAVQDRVLQHADLLGGGQRRLQPLVVAGRRLGGGPQVGEALQQDVEERRRHLQLDAVPAQQL